MCSIYFWILVVLVVLMQLHLPNRGLWILQHSHCGEGLLSARQSSHHAALAGSSCTVQSGKKKWLKWQQLCLPPPQSPQHLSWRRADFLKAEGIRQGFPLWKEQRRERLRGRGDARWVKIVCDTEWTEVFPN